MKFIIFFDYVKCIIIKLFKFNRKCFKWLYEFHIVVHCCTNSTKFLEYHDLISIRNKFPTTKCNL